MSKEFRPDTICVQAGWKPKKGEPRVLPIYQSTTFKYDTTEEMGWRKMDISTADFRTRPTMRWQRKSVNLRAV